MTLQRKQSKPKKLFKYLEKTKVEEILERARDNKRNYLLILTLWRTGIRNIEIVSLKKRDIHHDRVVIHQGKGKKELGRYKTRSSNLEDSTFFYRWGMIPPTASQNTCDYV